MKKLLLFFAAIMMASTELLAENIPNNQIWYTTLDGKVVTLDSEDKFNVAILTNTYQDGKGVITFDGELEWIGQGAFYQNETLESVAFPASLASIGNLAFAGCAELKAINLNQGLEAIGQSAFNGCDAMTEISIPSSVRALINYCLGECDNLTTIYVNWTEAAQIPKECENNETPDYPYVHNNVFFGIARQDIIHSGRPYATLYVPAGTENLYYRAAGWNKFGTILENLTDVKPAAIAAIETARQGVDNVHIEAMANDAIDSINAATSSFRIEVIKMQTLADMEHAKAILTDLPTAPEGTAGNAVTVTKGEKSVTLINPDKVVFFKK